MTTPLYHAEYHGLSGVCFAIGETRIFAMVDDGHLYVVPAGSVVVKDRLPDDMAAQITHRHIEPRLWSLDRGQP